MSTWTYIYNRIKALPLGLWAALGTALALLGLYLRGRRLEAELAAARLRTEAARASAESARNEGAARVHLERAQEHAANVEALQEHVITMRAAGAAEQKRLAALPPSQVTSEFLKLAARKKVSP